MIAAPARAAETQALFARALGGQKVSEHKTQLRHKGGQLVDASLTAYPIAGARGEIVGVAEVVSEAGRAEPVARPQRHKRQTQSAACPASIC